MNSRSRPEFIFGGIRQSGLVFAALLLLSAFGWLGAIYHVVHVIAWVVFGFAVSVLSGPVLWVLMWFDIGNKTLYLLWAILVVPYWCCLGMAAGMIRWKFAVADPVQEHSAAAAGYRRQTRWIVEIVALALAIVMLPVGPIAGPNFISSGPSITSRIMNNLRQIDGAKQQFALEKNLPPEYVPTEAELQPYLRYLRPAGPERYVLNSIREPPYAVLDSDWRIRRRGWREGYTIPRQEFRLQ